jgi:hypothetical protein
VTAKASTWVVLAALATSAQGQEQLVGTWQLIEAEPARFTLEVRADGGFEIVLPAAAVFDGDEEGGDDDFDIAEHAEAASFYLVGRWQAEGDRLTIWVDRTDFSAGGLSLDEFWMEMGRALAAFRAETEAVDAAEYEGLEQSTIDLLFALFPPDELMAELTALFDGTVYRYAVDGGTMTLTGPEGQTDAWRRVEPTVMLDSSWGQVKAGLRTAR